MSFVNITEAARLAECSEKTLRRAIDAGELAAQPRQHKNQPLMIDLAALQVYLEKTRGVQLHDPTPQAAQSAQTTVPDDTLAARIAALEQRMQEMEKARDEERMLGGGSDYQALTLATLSEKIKAEQRTTTWLKNRLEVLGREKSTFALSEELATQHQRIIAIEDYKGQIDALAARLASCELFDTWDAGALKELGEQMQAGQQAINETREAANEVRGFLFTLTEEVNALKQQIEPIETSRQNVQALPASTPTEALQDLAKRIEQAEKDEAQDVAALTQHIESLDKKIGGYLAQHKQAIESVATKLNEMIATHQAVIENIKDINGHLADLREATKSRRKRTQDHKPADSQEGSDGMARLADFAAAHGVRQATVEGVVEHRTLTPIFHQGTLYLGRTGQRQFWQIFNNGPGWADCPGCPHDDKPGPIAQ
jgi:hypothetical protein